MKPSHLTLAATVRIVDSTPYTAEFAITSATVDSYLEVVNPNGADLTRYNSNPIVLNAHISNDATKTIGRTTSISKRGGGLYATIRFAADVDGADEAKLIWNLIKGGFIRTTSIGFSPTKALTPLNGKDFDNAKKALGIEADADVRRIYMDWELLEISIVPVPANPDALIVDGLKSAQRAGLLTKSLLASNPAIAKALSAKTQTPDDSMASKSFMSKFRAATGLDKPSGESPAAASDFRPLESARLSRSPSNIHLALRAFNRDAAAQRDAIAGELVSQMLADPDRRKFWNALARCLSQEAQRQVSRSGRPAIVQRFLDEESGGLGSILLSQEMAEDILSLIQVYGQYSTLGVQPVSKAFGKVANITALPTPVWVQPSQGSAALTPDVAFAGSSLLTEMNTVGALLNVSLQLLDDEAVDLSPVFITVLTQALAAAIDGAAFAGDGSNAFGAQTGIVNDNAIATVAANAGNVSLQTLSKTDFANTIAAVTPGALQKKCNWWISPSLLPSLLLARDGSGPNFLLKSPDETGDGTWRICGFEVVWTSAMPAANTPGAIVAAFGHGPSYNVFMRDQIAVEASNLAPAVYNSMGAQFRATARVQCQTRLANGLAKLALAAN